MRSGGVGGWGQAAVREAGRVLRSGGVAAWSVWGRDEESPMFTAVPRTARSVNKDKRIISHWCCCGPAKRTGRKAGIARWGTMVRSARKERAWSARRLRLNLFTYPSIRPWIHLTFYGLLVIRMRPELAAIKDCQAGRDLPVSLGCR